MIITWEVEDGYAGASRPQSTEIDDQELADCDSEEEREALIRQSIQEDFEQNITWYETGRER